MYMTPRRPVKRQLFLSSSRRPVKRGRTAQVRVLNRRTTSGPKTSGTLTQQVKSLQKVVRNLTPELKYLDVSLTTANITSAGVVFLLSAIAQGDTQGTRTANTINVNSIAVRGSLSVATDAPIINYFRFALVVDREQVADTAPTAAAVFTGANPVSALPELDNLERFRILWLSHPYDFRRMALDSDNTTAVPTMSALLNKTWTGNIKVSFNGTGVSDSQKNGIYLVMLTDSTANTADFSGTSRIGFTDV